MTPAPLANRDQRMAALAQGTQIRVANAAQLRRIERMDRRDGVRAACEILRSPRGAAGSIRAGRLLGSVRWLGKERSRPMLAAARTKADAKLRTLDRAQRVELAAQLERWVSR